MQRFTDLKVWRRSHALVLRVYRLTVGFPGGERLRLVSQLRRAAVSVPTNLAEGVEAPGQPGLCAFLEYRRRVPGRSRVPHPAEPGFRLPYTEGSRASTG